MRKYTPIDHLILAFDGLLHQPRRKLEPARANPAEAAGPDVLTQHERDHAAGLMRVNHAGEVAAQALYEGQALLARDPDVRGQLEAAAREEGDHLAWCRERLGELDGQPSRLDPLWFAGSFAIGLLAGSLGDRRSLGFVAETERQVVRHLDRHHDRLPPGDARSRSILVQMASDERRHGTTAFHAGGVSPPAPVRALMGLVSKVMTKTAYWL